MRLRASLRSCLRLSARPHSG